MTHLSDIIGNALIFVGGFGAGFGVCGLLLIALTWRTPRAAHPPGMIHWRGPVPAPPARFHRN
jgi:hypothetical protein